MAIYPQQAGDRKRAACNTLSPKTKPANLFLNGYNRDCYVYVISN